MSDLTRLGLSSYEDRAYRALLALGPAPARDAAERAEIPTGRIYDVLDGLEGRELVRRRSDESPTRFAAVDPDEAVDRLLAARRRDLERRESEYREAAEAVRSELAPVPPIEASFWPTSLGSEAAVTLWEDQVRTATDRLRFVVGAPYDAADWSEYAREVAPAARIDGDVTVRLLLGDSVLSHVPDRALAELRADVADLAVRVGPDVPFTYDVVDGVEACLDVPAPFDPTERLGVAISREESLVRALADRFDRAWDAAVPVSVDE